MADDPYDLEKECLGVNNGVGTHATVWKAIKKVTAASSAERALSLARAAHRYGYLDQALRVTAPFLARKRIAINGLLLGNRARLLISARLARS